MSSIVDANTGKIENWRVYAQNKNNKVDFELTNFELFENNVITKEGWSLCINNHNYQTSYINNYDSKNLMINTISGSEYYLGQPDNEINIDILNKFFYNND